MLRADDKADEAESYGQQSSGDQCVLLPRAVSARRHEQAQR